MCTCVNSNVMPLIFFLKNNQQKKIMQITSIYPNYTKHLFIHLEIIIESK